MTILTQLQQLRELSERADNDTTINGGPTEAHKRASANFLTPERIDALMEIVSLSEVASGGIAINGNEKQNRILTELHFALAKLNALL